VSCVSQSYCTLQLTVYCQTSWCLKGFYILVYRRLSPNYTVVTTIYFAYTALLSVKCCVAYQSQSHIWYTDLDYCSYRLPKMELGLTVSVTGRQGMVTPLRYYDISRGPCFALFSNLYFLQDLWDWLLFIIYVILLKQPNPFGDLCWLTVTRHFHTTVC
jgi:hypothetical protein